MPFIECRCGHASNRHGRGKRCRAEGCDCQQFVRGTPKQPRPPRPASYYREYRIRRGGLSRAEYDARRHRHPSLNCYKDHHCRCEGCRAWNRVDCRDRALIRPWL